MSEGQEKRKKGLEGKGDEGKGGSESKHQAVTPQQHAETTITERKDLIELAVKFLNNPRVQGSPMVQKRTFLKNKGLTDAEIDRAVELAQSTVPISMATTNQIAQPPPLPPRPPPRSWGEYAVMALVVGGVGYAVLQFVKNYVIPWFEGPRVQDQKLDDVRRSVQQLQDSVNTTVGSLNETTTAVRDLLSKQQEHLEGLTNQVNTLQTVFNHSNSDHSLKDLKDEISSLKGLLLNRHQFPTPSRQGNLPGIPSWQRMTASLPGTPLKPQEEDTLIDATNGTANGSLRQSEFQTKLPVENGENTHEWHDATDLVN